MSFPLNEQPFLATTTIVPKPSDDEDNFVQYLTRLYEDIAFAVNSKDFIFFTMPISNVPTDIPNVANFGAFLVAVSGVVSGQPAGVWALAKSTDNVVGQINVLSNDVGTGATWAGFLLTITCPAPFTNYKIAHNLATTADFNVRIITTQ